MTLREVINRGIERVKKAKWNPLSFLEIVYQGKKARFHYYYRGKANLSANKEFKPLEIKPEAFNWDKNQWEEWRKQG